MPSCHPSKHTVLWCCLKHDLDGNHSKDSQTSRKNQPKVNISADSTASLLPFQCHLSLSWTPLPNAGPAATSVLWHSNGRAMLEPAPRAGQKLCLPHTSSHRRGQRVRKAIPYPIAFLSFLSQSTKPFSIRVVGLSNLFSVTDGSSGDKVPPRSSSVTAWLHRGPASVPMCLELSLTALI